MSVDLDCSTSLSASHLETEGVMRNLEQCSGGYKENDRILVLYGKGKTLRTYEAKVISVERGESKCEYLVHYSGWNNRYDEWIESSRIAGKLTEFTKRPHFSSVSCVESMKWCPSVSCVERVKWYPNVNYCA